MEQVITTLKCTDGSCCAGVLIDFPENHPDTLFLGEIRAHRMYVRPEQKNTFPHSNKVTYVEMGNSAAAGNGIRERKWFHLSRAQLS